MSFVDDLPGLESSCVLREGDEHLVMREESERNETALYADSRDSDPADLDLAATFETYVYEKGTCDRGTDPDSPVQDYGLLWITFDRNGDLQSFIWHFDFLVDQGAHHRKTGRQGVPIVRERFTLRGLEDLAWDIQTGRTTGTFNLHHYTLWDGDIVHEDIDQQRLQFVMTVN